MLRFVEEHIKYLKSTYRMLYLFWNIKLFVKKDYAGAKIKKFVLLFISK